MSKPGRKKKDYFEWWMDRINTLKGYQQEAPLLYAKTNVAYEVGAWAILKLALLAFYVDVYSSIIKARFKTSYYIDLFAGSGLNKIEKTNDIVFGSALIADRVPKSGKKFTKLILIEKDQEASDALRTILPAAKVITADVNETGLQNAMKEFPKEDEVPFLAFVDPEGLEIDWVTLQKLLESWSDVMINYQPTAVRRIRGSVNYKPAYAETLTRYFGSEEWKQYRTDDDLFKLYLKRIMDHKDIVIPVKVQGPGSFYYYIIFAVRRTGGPQGWVDAIERAQAKIEKATSRNAERFLQIFSGAQATLV